MKEFDDPRVKDEADLIEERDFLLGLQKVPGYEMLLGAMTEEANRLSNLALQPLKSRDEVLEEQFNKGVLKGILWAGAWVNSRIKMINEDLDYINRKQEMSDED